MPELDAVVQPVPDPRQEQQGDGDEAVRVVGGDLIDAAARLQQRVAARGPGTFAYVLGHGLAHRPRAQHRGDDGATVREVRADAGRARLGQLRAQRPGHAPRGRGGVRLAPEEAAQRDRRAQLHPDVAAVDQHRERAAQAAPERPVLREQQPNQRTLLLRRATPVHADRDQRDIECRIGAQRIDQHPELFGNAPVEPGAPEADRPLECEGSAHRKAGQQPAARAAGAWRARTASAAPPNRGRCRAQARSRPAPRSRATGCPGRRRPDRAARASTAQQTGQGANPWP